MNTFGYNLRFTSAGESHGPALTGILDGFPAGVAIDFAGIEQAMMRRRPGGKVGSQRRETDMPVFLSGIKDGISLGTPVAFTIANTDSRSADYDALAHTYRPSHADYTYQAKYGIRDHRGGGRASARETALRVVAGELAAQWLAARGVAVHAFSARIGRAAVSESLMIHPDMATADNIYNNVYFCPEADAARAMEAELRSVAADHDTTGGIVAGYITGLPAGVGEPIFGKLQGRLAEAMMSINAAHAFDYGMGMESCCGRGSQLNDAFVIEDGTVRTATNHSGGIQGGISNGMPVCFRVGFKPIATLMRPQSAIDDRGNSVELTVGGRHDVCALPRAVAVVRAMAALAVADLMMSPHFK